MLAKDVSLSLTYVECVHRVCVLGVGGRGLACQYICVRFPQRVRVSLRVCLVLFVCLFLLFFEGAREGAYCLYRQMKERCDK